MKTRAQEDLILAERLISDVEKQYPKEDDKVRKTYGSLCHSFPVMVRTAGLCQALAFSQAKAQADDERIKKAHGLLLHHVEKVVARLEPSLGEGKLLEAIRDASATEYMLYTRRILSAWIYFKRFAESILKVKAGEDQD